MRANETLEEASEIPPPVDDTSDRHRRLVVNVCDHIGLDRPESVAKILRVPTRVTLSGKPRETDDRRVEFVGDSVCRIEIVRGDVLPNLEQVGARLWAHEELSHPALPIVRERSSRSSA